jgi:hypothetical protein
MNAEFKKSQEKVALLEREAREAQSKANALQQKVTVLENELQEKITETKDQVSVLLLLISSFHHSLTFQLPYFAWWKRSILKFNQSTSIVTCNGIKFSLEVNYEDPAWGVYLRAWSPCKVSFSFHLMDPQTILVFFFVFSSLSYLCYFSFRSFFFSQWRLCSKPTQNILTAPTVGAIPNASQRKCFPVTNSPVSLASEFRFDLNKAMCAT